VYASTKGIAFEVIVVDNASTDDSVDMIKSAFPGVMLIANAENRGFAAANNQGMAIAKGRYVLLLNSDTIVLDNALAKVLAFADSRPDAGVVACRVLNADRSLQRTCFMFPSILNLFLWATGLSRLSVAGRFLGREQMLSWNRDSVRDVDAATGCFMLVRRDAIDHVGMMDDSYFMYFEETDWCYRFKKAGWKVLFTPEAQIIHLGGASSSQVRSKMFVQYTRSMLLFFRKHKGWLTYRFACLLLALCFFLRAPLWLAKAVFSTNSRGANVGRAKSYAAGALMALRGVRN
jgi:GT2 family glycosyltransferase